MYNFSHAFTPSSPCIFCITPFLFTEFPGYHFYVTFQPFSCSLSWYIWGHFSVLSFIFTLTNKPCSSSNLFAKLWVGSCLFVMVIWKVWDHSHLILFCFPCIVKIKTWPQGIETCLTSSHVTGQGSLLFL